MSNHRVAAQIRKWCEQTKEDMTTIARKTALDLLEQVVSESPVANPSSWKTPRPHIGGTFRANWQVTLNERASGILDEKDSTGNGFKTINREMAVLTTFTINDNAIYITNNLPYAEPLEFGHSKQAPSGWIARAVMNAEINMQRAIDSKGLS